MSNTKPLVPAEIDLRDFAFLPLDVVRLRDSGLAVESSGDEFRAAVLLWCVAWHQIPAASLPGDDRSLAMFAGFGRDTKSWLRVRAGALRGFVACDDGRLYHAVLAEKAIEAWDGKLRLRHRRECERIKKAAQRARVEAIYPSFDEWKSHVSATGDDKWCPVSPGTPSGRPEKVPDGVPGESHPLKGQGIGDRGQGTGDSKDEELAPSDDESSSADRRSRPRAAATDPPESPAVVSLPLNDGSDFPVTEVQVREFADLYPAVDVAQELRSMRGWCVTNPTNRKTRSGVLRFVNRWLAKAQNDAPGSRRSTNAPHRESAADRSARLAREGDERDRRAGVER